MSGNVRRCHRLTCGTGGGTRGIIHPCLTSGGMGGQRSLSDYSHPEHPGVYPRLERFEGVPGAAITRIFFLKTRQNTPSAVNSPDSQRVVVDLFDQLDKLAFVLGK
jgi:hypothetical protein